MAHFLIYSPSHSAISSFTYLIIHLFNHSFISSFTLLFIHSITYHLTHSLPHSLISFPHFIHSRAPIGLFYHAAWFTQPQNMEGFERFLDTILSLDDVWFVTGWQVIQWMRNLSNPTDPLNFEPFQCNNEKVRNIFT